VLNQDIIVTDPETDYSLITGLLDGLKPVAVMTVSEWADTYRKLSTVSSAEPGPWETARVPFTKEIMDSMSPNSGINEVVVMKGVQLALTESGLNIAATYIDLDPCSIMYVMPTVDLSKAISKDRVDPMIEACDTLRYKIKPARERDSGNTTMVKSFPGGRFIFAGANSAASLRSRSVRVLILDETDAYPRNLDNEGSPISLAEKRTSTFGAKRKIYKISTPTVDGLSVIQKEFDDTDQRKYYVPCPHCNEMQVLLFECLKWESGKYDTAKYFCPHCAAGIEERFKTKMLAAGEWRATVKSKRKTKRGYHISTLYSPLGWFSWGQIAEDYEKALKDDILMRTFVNTVLGEVYKEKGEVPDWNNIYDRRETYERNKPSKDVMFITIGVDVQKTRLEYEVVGWCKGKRSYSIDYVVIPGDTSQDDVWNELAAVVNRTWVREDKRLLNVKLMAVDTGWNTQKVYDFCRRFPSTQVLPVKGSSRPMGVMFSPPKMIDKTKYGTKIGKVKVWMVDGGMIKQEIYGWLKTRINEAGLIPNGYCHFPEYGPDYFKGLTGEEYRYTVNKRTGQTEYQWFKIFDNNEPLDCRVYARAAAAIVGLDRLNDEQLEQMAIRTHSNVENADKKKDKRKRDDDFWN
jgi:phage terminase large subunit GpA-like protein